MQHLRALQHPKATKTTAKTKAKKEQEAREGEYMAGESDNVLELTTIYATKAQAMRAAQAKWDKIQRGVAEFSILLAIGRADLFPETPVAVKGFKRVIDEQAWIISRVVHNLNENGYTTGLELEVKVSDVEYEAKEIDGRMHCICLFYMDKVSKINASETLKGAHHVSLSKMPLCRTCSH